MNHPKLIIVCGLPGSGKSTVSEGLSKELGIPVFSVDPIESAIIKSGIAKSFETGFAAYLVAESLAAANIVAGNSAIIDSVSAVVEAKQMWRTLAKKHGVPLVIIECVLTDKNQHKARIEKRVRNLHGIPEVTWDGVNKRKEEYVAWDEERLTLDAVNSPSDNVQRAVEYIASSN